MHKVSWKKKKKEGSSSSSSFGFSAAYIRVISEHFSSFIMHKIVSAVGCSKTRMMPDVTV